MTDDIIRKATTADYIETIDNLRAEVKRLRSQSVEQVFRRKNEEIAAKDARIKELETHDAALEERLRQELTHTAAQREIIDQQEARTEELKAQVDQSRTEIVGRIQECQCCMAHGESAYMQRLEAAFLESEAENQFHRDYGESDWEIHPDEEFDDHHGRNWYREEAREALERIKELEAEVDGMDENLVRGGDEGCPKHV